MARYSIAIRLALGLSIGTTVFWLGAAAISGVVMRNELRSAFDETLKQSALRLLPLAVHDLREPDEVEEREITGLGDQDEYFTWYVRSKTGDIVIHADDVQKFTSNSTIADGFSDMQGKRVFARTDRRSGYSIVVMENTDHRSGALNASAGALILPLAGLIPLFGVAIWFGIRLAMRPVERLRHDIAARGSRNLTPLSSEGHPFELAPIADAVADLLTRLQTALNAERAFAASSAHELRTPIAGALAQTQQLTVELGDAPASKRLKEIEVSLKHLSQLSETLLQLSRIDAGFARTEIVSDLLPVVHLVLRDFQSSPSARGRILLHLAEGADLAAPLDVDAFAIALRNLVQNALIHGAENGPVDVYVGTDKTVRIVNDGPVVPAEIQESLGQPFVRGNTMASGSGLGLSIARMIMEQSGGSLNFGSPATDRHDGFDAVLELPHN